jgi:hypothetical protein
VDESPLPKPEHLRDVPMSRRQWFAQRPLAFVCAALGVISFIIVSTTQTRFWSTPDWRISVPCFAVTTIAAVASIARREQGAALWAIGLGMAGAALVLGWFMMLAIVVGATVLAMVILSTVM